jgi:hypothetical protein
MNSMIQHRVIRRAFGAFAIAAVFVVAGCATTPEQQAESNMNKAYKQIQDAYNDMGKVEKDLAKNSDGSAERAFNSAIGHIDKAIGYYAKAVTTPDQKGAVQDLQFGMDQMKACIESLEKNDTSSAQAQCDKAQDYFDKASGELWETS